MSQKTLRIVDFQGGIGTLGQKRDQPGSARFTKNLDPYSDLDFVTLSRKTTKKSSTTVVNLPLWMEDGSPWATDRYVYDLGGNIYKVTSADAVSLLRTVTGGAGEGLKVFDDYLYYILGTDIGRYGRLSGTPAFDDSLTSWWDGAISDIQTTGGGTGEADYVPPTTIAETATARQTFTATHDPVKEITINDDVVGSGNRTLTLHDSENNLIGSKTIANASLIVGDNTFTFATALRVVIGNEYHFHVTSTVADGGVDTNVATDLEGAEFTVEYGVLIDSTYHPAVVLEDLLIIGNERYLATFNQASYDPNTIAFDPGFEVRTLIKTEEYVIAECYKGATVVDAEESKRYYWDGIQPSFNFSEPIKIGAPNATAAKTGNVLVGVYGFKGTLFDSKSEKELTHEAPKLAKGKYLEVYPGSIDIYEGRVLVGLAGYTDDTTGVELGVYEYGGQVDDSTKGLNLPFIISTGNTQNTNLKVSLVKVIGKDIYIGFRDNTAYGVDKVTLGDDAATSGLYESLIFDDGNSKKEKLAVQLKATFVALAAGESVQLGYQIDRSGTFTMGTAEDTDDEVSVELDIYSRFKEIEFKFVLASTGGTFPKLTSLIFEYDSLSEEGVD